MSESPFVMIGSLDEEVCVDGVCAVPTAVAETRES